MKDLFNENDPVSPNYPRVSDSMGMSVAAPKYAGFWIRFFAAALDILFVCLIVLAYGFACLLIGLFLGLIMSMVMSASAMTSILALLSVMAYVVAVILGILYEPYLLSSKHQATLGMMAMNLKIVNTDMQPISFGRAFARYLCQILTSITCGIGYLMIVFTKKKQALHDMITETLIVRD